jgi:hypothetical protein
MAENPPRAPPGGERQPFQKGIEVVAGLTLLLFENPSDSDRKPLSLRKDPAVPVRDLAKIEMHHLQFLFRETDG